MKSIFGTLRRKVSAIGGMTAAVPVPDATLNTQDGTAIPDYPNLDALLRDVGPIAEDMNIIIAVDMTRSNETSGFRSFGGRCLHDNLPGRPGPYLTVIETLQKTLKFDTDHAWPLYFFGSDEANQAGGKLYIGTYSTITDLREAYVKGAASQTLSGPTTFVPVIEETIGIVSQTNRFHLLLILTDGVIVQADVPAHYKALAKAARVPMAVCAIGVGDANFDTMKQFDDAVPGDADVFNFVPFNQTIESADRTGEDRSTALMFQTLMELPAQYESARRRLGYKPQFGPLAGKPSSGLPPAYTEL